MYYRFISRFIIIVIITHSSILFSQSILHYKNVIDYYDNEVKSTVLDAKGNFLKDGQYYLNGDVEDFDFLLKSYLGVSNKEAYFLPNDSLVYSGTIKDSLKVGTWNLQLLRNKKISAIVYDREIKKEGIDFGSEGSNGMFEKIVKMENIEYSVKYLVTRYDIPDSLALKTKLLEHTDYWNNKFYKWIISENKEIYSEEFNLKKNEETKEITTNVETYYNNCRANLDITRVFDGNHYFILTIKRKDENKNLKGYWVEIKEQIKDKKLKRLIIDDNNIKKDPYFSKILGNNYFPAIVYQQTK